MKLRESELRATLEFLAELNEFDGSEPFTTELLDRLLELVPVEFATYMQMDFVRGVVHAYVPCSNEGATPDSDVPWNFSAEEGATMSEFGMSEQRRTGQPGRHEVVGRLLPPASCDTTSARQRSMRVRGGSSTMPS